MKYRLKSENGKVTFKMKTGKDLVRNTMILAYAQSILARAKSVVEIDDEVLVDDLYYFPVEKIARKKKTEVIG